LASDSSTSPTLGSLAGALDSSLVFCLAAISSFFLSCLAFYSSFYIFLSSSNLSFYASALSVANL
jgi:hypothetical protein